MNPTSYKWAIRKTAEQLQLPEELVRDLIIYHYKEIRKRLSNLENVRVKLNGLGYFDIKYWKIDAKAVEYKKMLNYYALRDTKRNELISKDIRIKLDNVLSMQTMCEGEKIKREKCKKRRKEDEQEYYRRLEEQKKNSGGIVEPVVSEPVRERSGAKALENL